MTDHSILDINKKIEKIEYQIDGVESQREENRCKIRDAELVLHKVDENWTDHDKLIFKVRSSLENALDRFPDEKSKLFKKEKPSLTKLNIGRAIDLFLNLNEIRTKVVIETFSEILLSEL